MEIEIFQMEEEEELQGEGRNRQEGTEGECRWVTELHRLPMLGAAIMYFSQVLLKMFLEIIVVQQCNNAPLLDRES